MMPQTLGNSMKKKNDLLDQMVIAIRQQTLIVCDDLPVLNTDDLEMTNSI